jgi:hypothetical protein
VVLLLKGKFVGTLCDRMQDALICVENWCREIGLSVNGDKTTMVLFTNNRNIRGFYNPKLFGTELRMTDQVKYLRVILDKKLDWKAHLENRMRKTCIAYWQCRRGKTWGLSPKVVAWLYTSVVRPIFSYASLVWWKRVELKNALSLAADDVFGNYWWYASNTNVCFRGYVNVATLTFVH